MTYCNMETEEIKRFQSGYIFEDLERWFYELIGSMKVGEISDSVEEKER